MYVCIYFHKTNIKITNKIISIKNYTVSIISIYNSGAGSSLGPSSFAPSGFSPSPSFGVCDSSI